MDPDVAYSEFLLAVGDKSDALKAGRREAAILAGAEAKAYAQALLKWLRADGFLPKEAEFAGLTREALIVWMEAHA